MSLYAQYAALLDGVLDELVADGALPAGLERRGVAVEPPRDAVARRPRDQRGDGAGQGRRHQPARAGGADRAQAGGAAAGVVGRDRRARASSTCAWRPTRGATSCGRSCARATPTARRRSARASGSMSNMSRPTRPGRCTWAIAAARWSATAWRGCSRRRASASPRNIMSTTPAAQVDTLARSVHLRYREALGEDIGEIPEGMYPGDYLVPVGQALAAEYRRPIRRRAARASGSDLFRTRAIAAMLELIRHDLAPARHPPRPVRVRGRAPGSGRGRPGARDAARQGPGLRRRSSSGPRASTSTTSGSRSS